jgi:hypothetical protein
MRSTSWVLSTSKRDVFIVVPPADCGFPGGAGPGQADYITSGRLLQTGKREPVDS